MLKVANHRAGASLACPHKASNLVKVTDKDVFMYLFTAVCNIQVQKIFILPHRRDWNFLGGGGFWKSID